MPVEILGLGKCFGRRQALREISLQLHPGEVFGYLGPNGAGKTTTLRVLMGFLRPTSGSARVFGQDAWRAAAAIHRRVGYVAGEVALYDRLTGREQLEFLAHLRGGIEDAHLRMLVSRLDAELDRPARTLSKGNRQKLAILQALMCRPDLLVLDEPTSGLDPLGQQQVHELLREHAARGGTTLLSSHVLSEVQRVADRVGILRAGRLVAVESLADLRRKALHHVRVRFCLDGAPLRVEDFAGAGVRDIAVTGDLLSCSATQEALDPLLRVVTRRHVVDLTCEEAGLDETFLAFYDGAADAR